MNSLLQFVTACRRSDLVMSELPTDVCAGVPKALDENTFWIPFYRVSQVGEDRFLLHSPIGSIQVKYPSGEITRFEKYPFNEEVFAMDALQGQKMAAATEQYIAALEAQMNGAAVQGDLQKYLLDSVGPMKKFYQRSHT